MHCHGNTPCSNHGDADEVDDVDCHVNTGWAVRRVWDERERGMERGRLSTEVSGRGFFPRLSISWWKKFRDPTQRLGKVLDLKWKNEHRVLKVGTHQHQGRH